MDDIVTWTTIRSQLYQVNWENYQIYKNCTLFGITFRQTSAVHLYAFFDFDFAISLHLFYVNLCRYLSGNRINTILKDDLPKNLITLELRGNPLADIKFDALQSMPRLRKLYVHNHNIWNWNHIHINNICNGIGQINYCWFRMFRDFSPFVLCIGLRVMSDAKSLSELPSLEGCSSLEILRMDRANISVIPNTLCRNSSHLKSL